MSEKSKSQEIKRHNSYSDNEFGKMILVHRNELIKFLIPKTNSLSNAEDIISTTFYKAYKFKNKYEEGTNLRAWLYTIALNEFINEYRKKMIKFTDYVDNEQMAIIKRKENDQFENDHLKKMLSDDIYKALNKLAPNYKFIIIACDLHGYSYEEAAAITNVPPGTLRSRLFRARNILAEQLQHLKPKNSKRKV